MNKLSIKNVGKGSGDKTLLSNNLKHMLWLCSEYELVKSKQHTHYAFVTEFYNAHNIKRQNFIKFYNRYKQSGNGFDLLPQKRGPRYKSRRTLVFIENKVLDLRKNGLNRFEIHADLQEVLKSSTPCPSTIYNICRRYGLNKMTPKKQEKKRKIIKERAGQLGHIDCHYLSKGMIDNDNKRYYLVGLIDNKSSVAWCEIVPEITSLTVMFACMKMMNIFKKEFEINFEEILTDNGAEFGGGIRKPESISKNPFTRLLLELRIKHRKTRPYRPQTNGKIERFWRTIEEDLMHEMVFDSLEHAEDELFEYMVYYNYGRPHTTANGKTPSHNINKNIQ